MTYAGMGATILLIAYLLTNSADLYLGTDNEVIDPALYFLVAIGLCNSIIWPTVFTMGIEWHAIYALILVFIHTFIVFSIESIGSFSLGTNLLKIVSTTILTVFTILLYQF